MLEVVKGGNGYVIVVLLLLLVVLLLVFDSVKFDNDNNLVRMVLKNLSFGFC